MSSRSWSRSRAGRATSTSTTRTAHVYRLDRVLSSAVFYNFDYGFIEGTRAGDGDHTDALLIIDEPTFTGCHVWARPIGGLEMRDEKGFDFKVLCVAIGDAHQQHIERLDQVRPHRLVEIEHFFQTYKALEDKTVKMRGWRERDRALEVLRADRATWEREVGTTRRRDDPTRSGPPARLRGPARATPVRRGPAAAGGRRRRRGPRRARPAARRAGRRTRRPLGPAGRAPPDAAVPRADARRPGIAPVVAAVRQAASTLDAVRDRRRRRRRVPVAGPTAGAVARDHRWRRGPGRGSPASVDRSLTPAGWPPRDRPFRAHLTLARSDGVAGRPGHRRPARRCGARPRPAR